MDNRIETSDESWPVIVGQRVRQFRERAGVSLERLSEIMKEQAAADKKRPELVREGLIAFGADRITNVENGHGGATNNFICACCAALKITPQELFMIPEAPPEP